MIIVFIYFSSLGVFVIIGITVEYIIVFVSINFELFRRTNEVFKLKCAGTLSNNIIFVVYRNYIH